jgi:septum formation inhibitor MinC
MAKLNTAVVAGGGVEILSAVLAGAAANTTLVIAGLRADAKLIEVTEHAVAALPADRKSVTTVAAGGGGIKVNDDTTGNAVRVLYAQRAR